MDTIETFIRGKISKKMLTHYLIPLAIGLFCFFLFLARLFFPDIPSYPYNWTTSMISRLGWPDVNVMGWPFFSIAFILFGISTIPLISYKYRLFSKFSKRVAWFIRLFLIGVSISMILLGAIPNFDSHPIFMVCHTLNAAILVAGGALAVLISMILISKRYFKKDQKETLLNRKFVMPYLIVGILGAIFIGLLFFSLARLDTGLGHYVHDPATPLLLSPPMWEWLTMVNLIFMIVFPCYFLSPE